MPWFWERTPAVTETVTKLDMAQFTPHPRAGFLVGGAVRDTLLGRSTRDLDWLVADPQTEAERAAAVLGGSAFVLDESRGHWRVVAAGATRDYAPLGDPNSDPTNNLNSDLDANLRVRDYTVNAVAAALTGALLDPTGGLGDLRAKRLRMVSEANLRSDPVRGLRGVRFAAPLGFSLEPFALTPKRYGPATRPFRRGSG